jgi:hypothetical protein
MEDSQRPAGLANACGGAVRGDLSRQPTQLNTGGMNLDGETLFTVMNLGLEEIWQA